MQKVRKILKSDLGKSISSGYILFFLNNVVALFLTPYMLQFISKEEYGFYILCIDFLAWVGFLEFGTNKVIESKAAHLIAQEDYKSLNKTFNSSFFFQIGIGLLIIPFYFILINSGIPENKLSHLHLVIGIFSISAGLSVFKNLFSAVIIASKKVHLDNRIQIISNLLNFTLIILLVPYIGVLGLAVINLFAIILVLFRSNFRLKKLFPSIKVRLNDFDKTELKSLFAHGVYFSLGSIATVILVKIDSFIIGREFGLAEVASFYITIKLFTLVQKVFQMFINNFRPHIAQLYGKKELEKIKQFHEIITPIALGLSCILIAVIMIFNQFFVSIWVGDNLFLSFEFSVLFGFYILLDLMTIPSRIILTASLFDLRNQSMFKILESLGRIVGILLLIKQVGINILPITSIISCLIFGNIFFAFQIKKYFSHHQLKIKSISIYFISALSLSILSLYALDYLRPFVFGLLIFGLIFTIFFFWRKFELLKNMKHFIH